MTRAVVFAYHNVGVRCLKVLLAHGVDVPLIFTHEDNPDEAIWFESVHKLAAEHDIRTVTPVTPNRPRWLAEIEDLHPDFIFSFYYRQMLNPALLAATARGAYNMHGSLLPKYRGRVPVNWAVLHGERETGATLHRMVAKPDAGEIVARQAVPILPDDTAHEVFGKVTLAAEMALDRILPQLIGGTAPHVMPDLKSGSYFGGRKPEDGRIDWTKSAAEIHNLVRAVAPPYPGAFSDLPDGKRLRVLRTLLIDAGPATTARPQLHALGNELVADCGSGRLRILAAELEGKPLTAADLDRDVLPLT